jgi:tRNA threonylcarbamoyladenosine biosynthesis protein TsaE
MGRPEGTAEGTGPDGGALSQGALEAWGRSVGSAVVDGGTLPLVLALRGPLGAGKSVLARAVARGAGVDGSMPSPTYNLLFTYVGRRGVTVYHLDLYRLEHPDDIWELGWEELGEGSQVVLIEWPDRIESLLPRDRWDVTLEFTVPAGPAADQAVDRYRTVRLTRHGAAPDLPSPDSSGPDSSGPDSSGPDSSGPDSSGPDSSGPDGSGPELPGSGGGAREEAGP